MKDYEINYDNKERKLLRLIWLLIIQMKNITKKNPKIKL